MPYSNPGEMRRRATRMREIAATFVDPETRRLILEQAEKLETEADLIERGERPSTKLIFDAHGQYRQRWSAIKIRI